MTPDDAPPPAFFADDVMAWVATLEPLMVLPMPCTVCRRLLRLIGELW